MSPLHPFGGGEGKGEGGSLCASGAFTSGGGRNPVMIVHESIEFAAHDTPLCLEDATAPVAKVFNSCRPFALWAGVGPREVLVVRRREL
jgi:hypothetical protein